MICNKCLEQKPEEEFYKQNKTKCKECIREYTKLYWRSNPDKRKANYKARDKKKYSDYYKEWYAKNGRKRDERKTQAHYLVNEAIKAGEMERAEVCECCQVLARTDGHHDDYRKPLSVRWLCRPCHRQQHTGR